MEEDSLMHRRMERTENSPTHDYEQTNRAVISSSRKLFPPRRLGIQPPFCRYRRQNWRSILFWVVRHLTVTQRMRWSLRQADLNRT